MDNLKNPEKEISASEQRKHFEMENAPAPEKRESKYESQVSEELKREIDRMEQDENARAEVEKSKEKIGYLGEQQKIEHLLELAREKGLVYAIQVARRMNEPYLLDVLHDTLAKEGFYKDFTK